MGTNKRYSAAVDRRMSERIDQAVPRPTPVTLTAAELDVANHPIKQAVSVIPVLAWVRFPETAVQAEADAFEWTDKAVHVSWKAADGGRHQAWVWASSVERRAQQ
ncbi:hypothetical protein [Subtercola frigoramans]|uniref:Uncharacterized protein n=1 Tax=Subtercola frigoramans TaxID=120298 RepID=A0ABS2L5U3_9MICO|nr:hypothetical protein [Subtercola frigoramans]MBM7472466.1 hypothetical protein [Subtercola frigoramans]